MKLTKHPNYTDRHRFMCPGCEVEHSLRLVVGRQGDSSWGWNGSFDRPTITPSIFVNRGSINPAVPACHSFVTNGRIQFLNDSTHGLAGQTVDLQNFPAQISAEVVEIK